MTLPNATFQLNGEQTELERKGQMPGNISLKAKWKKDGRVLELSVTRHFNRQGSEFTLTSRERWELAGDGKQLKVQRTVDTPMGTQDARLTFIKQ